MCAKSLIIIFTKNEDQPNAETKINNTKRLALLLQKQLQCDLFEIIPKEPYSNITEEIDKRARKEREDGVRPPIKKNIESLEPYDTIFFGYPIWYGDLPMPVYTFIEQNSWKGKTVIPFCSHTNVNVQSSYDCMKKAIKEANVLEGFGVPNPDVENSEAEISKWLKTLNL